MPDLEHLSEAVVPVPPAVETRKTERMGLAIARLRAAYRIPETSMLVFVLIALSAYFSLRSPYFLQWDNWVNILQAVSVAGIVAAPATLLMVAGQVDLSVGSGALLTGVVMSWFTIHHGLAVGVLAGLTAGVLGGAVNGFSVTVLRVNPIITTLGTLAAFRGVADLITNGQSTSVNGFDPLGNSRPFLNIPTPVLLFLGLAVVFWLVMRYTVFGRSMYAIGSNPLAARMVGIRATRLVFLTFVLSGLSFALSGLILVSELGSTNPNTGFGLELFVVTAVILGGASLSGGRGTMLGTVLALLILGVLNNGLVLLNVNTYWQDVVRGTLLIAAVAFDQLRLRRATR
jgi:ribose transport system permease protein